MHLALLYVSHQCGTAKKGTGSLSLSDGILEQWVFPVLVAEQKGPCFCDSKEQVHCRAMHALAVFVNECPFPLGSHLKFP